MRLTEIPIETSTRVRRALCAFSWKKRKTPVLNTTAPAQVYYTDDPRGIALFIHGVDCFPRPSLAVKYATRGDYFEGTRVCPCDQSDPRKESLYGD